jgi:hypothetical protein
MDCSGPAKILHYNGNSGKAAREQEIKELDEDIAYLRAKLKISK